MTHAEVHYLLLVEHAIYDSPVYNINKPYKTSISSCGVAASLPAMAGTAAAQSRQSSKRGQQGVDKRALSASICAVAGLLFPKNRWDQRPETNGPPFLLYLLCLFLKSVISFEAFEPSLFQRV
jgi:hypothetical protein